MNIWQDLKERNILNKDGKVDALGPYGKQKLTGREISAYFKKNKVKDPEIRKAVEVALDLGGAFDIAGKEIQKFYGRKIRNSKEVKAALKYANESVEFNQLVAILQEEESLTEASAFEIMQDIVQNKQAKKIKGVMVDMFTASVVVKAYEKVNDSNKKKIEKANLETLVKLAHKVMGMKEDYILEGRAMPLKKIARKYKREIEMLAKKGQSPVMGKHKVYMALYNLAWENGDINTDDPDQTDEVIDDYMDEMEGEFFAHIKDEYVKEWISKDGTRRRVHEKDKRKGYKEGFEKPLKKKNYPHQEQMNVVDTFRNMMKEELTEAPVLPSVQSGGIDLDNTDHTIDAGVVNYVVAINKQIKTGQFARLHKEKQTELKARKASKYYRLEMWEMGRAASIHAFVEIATGDIFKPAGWKAPAKGARGNVTDNRYIEFVTKYPSAYHGGHLYK